MAGNACKNASEKLRAEIAKAVAREKNVAAETIRFHDSFLFSADGKRSRWKT